MERSRQHSIVDFVRLGRIVDFFTRIVSVCLHLPPICEKRFVAVLLLILLCQHLIVGNRCPGDHCGSADGKGRYRGEWETDSCSWSRFAYSAHVKIHFDCTHRSLERSFKGLFIYNILRYCCCCFCCFSCTVKHILWPLLSLGYELGLGLQLGCFGSGLGLLFDCSLQQSLLK